MGIIIAAGRLYDGVRLEPAERMAVLVDGGVIAGVKPLSELTRTDREDARLFEGPVLMPGLIDTHAHLTFAAGADPLGPIMTESREQVLLRAVEHARTMLLSGVTTVRDCGGLGNLTLVLRWAVEQGLVSGPDILACGPPITITSGHLDFLGLTADSPEELRRAVRQLVRDGADFIKVCVTGGGMTPYSNRYRAQYSNYEMAVLVREALRWNRCVVAHINGNEGLRVALDAGVSFLEHCPWMEPEGICYVPELGEAIVKKRAIVGLTIGAIERNLEPCWWLDSQPQRDANTRQLIALGARLAVGTDAGVHHTPFDAFWQAADDLVVRLGLSCAEALRQVTSLNAHALGLRDVVGCVAPGLRANLLLLESDPGQSLAHLRDVQTVFHRGRPIRRWT